MRRELATVLDELRSGLVHSASNARMRLTGVEMNLPMDLLVVLRDGGLKLLADVPRSRGDDAWRHEPMSRLNIRWEALSRTAGDGPWPPGARAVHYLYPGHEGESSGEGMQR